MSRLRALLATVLVGVGGVLVTAGPAELLALVRLLLANAGLLLIAMAAAAILAAALPRGARAGPTIVAIVGLLVLWVTRNNWSSEFWWTAVGAGLVLIGCSVALAVPGARRPDDVDPVWRRAAILFRTRAAVESDVDTPAQLTLVVTGTLLEVDLRRAQAPGRRILELVVSCWLGRVEIQLPPHWAAVGGRLHTTYRVRLKGRLDDSDVYPYPTLEQLSHIASARAERYAANDRRPLPVAVVIHVLGARGEVELVGRE